MIIRFLGIPILKMLAGLFTKFAASTTNEYDNTIALTLSGLVEIMQSEDVFEIK